MSLNTSNLTGNIYLNCFASAMIEIVAYCVNWPLIKWFARPTVISCSMMLAGVMMMIIQLVPEGSLPLCVTLGTWEALSLDEIPHLFYVNASSRHARSGAGVRHGRKDRCLLFFWDLLPVFHWAHPHRGQEHGPRRHYYGVTHWHHHLSIHPLSRHVHFRCYQTHKQLTPPCQMKHFSPNYDDDHFYYW